MCFSRPCSQTARRTTTVARIGRHQRAVADRIGGSACAASRQRRTAAANGCRCQQNGCGRPGGTDETFGGRNGAASVEIGAHQGQDTRRGGRLFGPFGDRRWCILCEVEFEEVHRFGEIGEQHIFVNSSLLGCDSHRLAYVAVQGHGHEHCHRPGHCAHCARPRRSSAGQCTQIGRHGESALHRCDAHGIHYVRHQFRRRSESGIAECDRHLAAGAREKSGRPASDLPAQAAAAVCLHRAAVGR